MITTFRKLILIASVLAFVGCDKDFEQINTNPYGINDIDPALIFAGAQRTQVSGWETEHTIVQQFVNPFNSGATLGPNFNEDIDNFNNGKWDALYPGSLKNMAQALAMLENSNRVNLRSMIRIWRAQAFMGLVDQYGDVPYTESGQAYLKTIFYPKYDDDAAIYADLEKELKESIAALNPAGDYVPEDLFFGKNSRTPSGSATVQTEKWKKVGNSLLLRLGMRYSKLNPTKAAALATEALNGGVMTSNADNVWVTYDGTLYTNPSNGGLVNNNPRFYYAAEPFVNQLKSTNDPRGKFLVATYQNPNNPLADQAPNTNIADQFGVPVGVISTALEAAPYRGQRNGGLNYSQMNVRVVASQTAPTFWITYSQTALLLAEAAHRGWIPGGDAAAKTYYDNAIKADMDRYALYPGGAAVPEGDKQAYLSHPNVEYRAADALRQINTQYWITSITDGNEAWANFRRTGFPALEPNRANNNLNGGFIRRLSYPDYELSNNRENYQAAVQAIGGKDDLTTRVFWDTP
ncbi:SusD/RagB family nutrient-binding outer membrane lipoprotein [Pseudocnuella soli]|uniref:SusD/RagB family nutrient-binding outer membrane lipoprotein n=1 Tax=Pseudocnuella soli TaxID=2502779 RepID=UPI00195E9048|nr:SusD/RagB family nutrient-binding outer membrane lipoprotein [Pseudocnuella soli]